ncbi:5'-methylthioadenosine/adenosylhomocysteine nucleosidase [Candidatus Enterococcus willemsii]|uniref:adenosylhomocysteine nucleosidase n=1 Tax=Candidatus Enterococcus willemsii TaxID=1857215 RepID=A0ABQ6Z120_9ENTE|nr:5'-methylthioadenosine/adenosylhomocysteine nucleosidase [Enterococcus sp. CU12B]KAF1304614.1 5'-methylthioadenosine nucleosidase [Enterococcus sp. CU12B]
MKIAIIAAMKEELAPFRQQFAATVVWQKGKTVIEKVNDRLYLVESGIGKVNAAATATWLCEQVQPDFIINTGTIGSFRSEFALGDVVYTDRFVYSDVDATGFNYAFGQVPQMPADYPVAPELIAKLSTIFAEAGIPAHHGTIATSDSFMSDTKSIAAIRKAIPTITASDMESCALAQVASFYDIPIVNVRGISDHVGDSAPDTFDETVDFASNQAFQAVNALLENLR